MIDSVKYKKKVLSLISKKKSIINGSVSLFSDQSGELEAFIDFHLLTKWKTAADSLLATKYLARKNSEKILLVGSGNMSSAMVAAYKTIFPDANYYIWSRSLENASIFSKKHAVTLVQNLKKGVEEADIICTATMSIMPLIKGKWLRPGQHLDLIGSYRPDMREIDDIAIKKGRIFVDSFDKSQYAGECLDAKVSAL